MEFSRRWDGCSGGRGGIEDVLIQQVPVNLGGEGLLKVVIKGPREDYPTVCRRKVGLVRISLSDSGIYALCLNFLGLDSGGPMNCLVLMVPDGLTERPECFYQRRARRSEQY